jgi:hypothetical protein
VAAVSSRAIGINLAGTWRGDVNPISSRAIWATVTGLGCGQRCGRRRRRRVRAVADAAISRSGQDGGLAVRVLLAACAFLILAFGLALSMNLAARWSADDAIALSLLSIGSVVVGNRR